MNNDESYWQSVSPFPLSEKEQGIYNMVDSIKNVPLCKDVYALAEMLVNGFLNVKYVGFGPYFSLYSFNELEGVRIRLGVRTTKELSRRFRFVGSFQHLSYASLCAIETLRRIASSVNMGIFAIFVSRFTR